MRNVPRKRSHLGRPPRAYWDEPIDDPVAAAGWRPVLVEFVPERRCGLCGRVVDGQRCAWCGSSFIEVG